MYLCLLSLFYYIALSGVERQGRVFRENGQRCDTITYNVASFANKQDRTIGDVLKKMPGIEVKEDGKIYYNGRGINKFYIEGRDLVEGRYGIATNGIPQVNVGQVEVMKNHQPIKVMEGISFSDQAAINLKLKEGAKAKWIATYEMAAGISDYPDKGLWDANIFAMMFNKNFQNITTVKSNNTGNNLTSNIANHYAVATSDQENYFNVDISTIQDLEKERVTLNRSVLTSVSTLYSTSKESEIKSQFNYLYNHETSQSSLQTTYYLPDEDLLIREDKSAQKRNNLLNGIISFESNKKSSYLKNITLFDLSWNNTEVIIGGTYNNRQYTVMPIYSVSNKLQWIKNIDNHVIKFISHNHIDVNPHRLLIEKGSTENQRQTLSTININTSESASLEWPMKNYRLTLSAGIDGEMRKLESNLDGVEFLPLLSSNNILIGRIKLFATPGIRYQVDNFKISASFPINYYYYNLGTITNKKNDFDISPLLNVSWKITSRLSTNATAVYGTIPYNIKMNYEGVIMQNYRTLTMGTNEYATGKNISLMGFINYNNPTSCIFLTIDGMYVKSKKPFREVQEFSDDYRIFGLQRLNTNMEMWKLGSNFSSCIDFIRGVGDLTVSYINSTSMMMTGKDKIIYHSDFLKTELSFNGQIGSWINWNYMLLNKIYSLRMTNVERNTLHGWQHNLLLNLTPFKKWVVQLSGEYYNNEIVKNKYKNMMIVNCKVDFNLNKRFQLFAQTNNLLNRQRYDYTIYDKLSSIHEEHAIRGREFLMGFTFK